MNEGALAVVADGNLIFASMAEAGLRRLGYRTRVLPDGPDVAAEVERLAPDLVLVNLSSPGGMELLRQLRARPRLAATPVIGYAGHVERERFREGREAGADLVVPNSAIRKALPEVLARLERRRAAPLPEEDEAWPE